MSSDLEGSVACFTTDTILPDAFKTTKNFLSYQTKENRKAESAVASTFARRPEPLLCEDAFG